MKNGVRRLALIAGAGAIVWGIGVGCGVSGDPEGPTGAETTEVGEVSSALQTCVTIQRGTFGNVWDTTPNSLNPTSTSGGQIVMVVSGTSSMSHPLIKWDLSSIPTSAHIDSATLGLTQSLKGSNSTSYRVHRAEFPFNEASSNWSNYPGVAPTLPTLATLGPAYSGWATPVDRPLQTDITALVRDWVSGAHPNDGVVIEADGSYVIAWFRSSEDANVAARPSLTVCYNDNCPNSCDDGDPCTTDVCDPALDCVHTPAANGTACDDGDLCTSGEVCMAGACATGAPLACAPPSECLDVGTCDPATGQCSHPSLADGTACAGGIGTCTGGACLTACTSPSGCSHGNLALGKPATQSSTYVGFATFAASTAVDGNTDGSGPTGSSVTSTNAEAQPWWQVDLGADKAIAEIHLWNRTDCCGDRLSDFDVMVSDDADWNNPDFTYHEPGQAPDHMVIQAPTFGRYVRIQLRGTNHLSLAEVQVFSAHDLARGKTATQSSTYPLIWAPTAPASTAVDGQTDGALTTHTDLEPQPWWQVDLGAVYVIGGINLWNRTDCCGDRLSDFDVMVSDDADWNNPDFSHYEPGQAPAVLNIPVGVSGRYVRVQLRGTNNLSLAEVEVYACASCDDSVACTIDGCDPNQMCLHVPDHAFCDDGNPCTDDNCDLVGGCTHTNNTAPCDDGNACTTGDTCAAGGCVAGAPVTGVTEICGNLADDDCDGWIDNGCPNGAVELQLTDDITQDDIPGDALVQFFSGLNLAPTDYLYFGVDSPLTSYDGGLCTENASWYIGNYLTYASSAWTTFYKGAWNNWYKLQGGTWTLQNYAATNSYGQPQNSPFGWTMEWTTAGPGPYMAVLPTGSYFGSTNWEIVVFDQGPPTRYKWGGTATFRVGPDRISACGF